jgi:hypothetical protein
MAPGGRGAPLCFPMPQLYEFRPVTESPCGMGKGSHAGHGAHMILGMNRRYVITRTLGGWGIRDQVMSGPCALPGASVPLEWDKPAGAQGWLYLCRLAWGADLVKAPDGWRG